VTAETELRSFIAKFTPAMQEQIRACRSRMTARLPGAVQQVYDNYNFLVIGFGPNARTSDAVFSLAADRNRVNLCFLQRAPELADPAGLLRGSGRVVRTLRLSGPDDLGRPEVEALIAGALALARVPISESQEPALVIKSISANQRPRR
jgi:hypothetical protein